MTDDPTTTTSIPPDDPSRNLTVARPHQDQTLPHLGLVGDTYTTLVTVSDTNGIYTLIDMHVPPGGGPPKPAPLRRLRVLENMSRSPVFSCRTSPAAVLAGICSATGAASRRLGPR